MISTQNNVFPEIEKVIRSFNLENISHERKLILQALIDFMQKKITNKK